MDKSASINQPPAATRWRLWSTKDSIRSREPSIMAVIESCLAPVLYLWLASYVGWLLPLYVAVAVAPFVLLRTENSVALGVKWASALEVNDDPQPDPSLRGVAALALGWLAISLIVFYLWAPPISNGAVQASAILAGIFLLPLFLLIPSVLLAIAVAIRAGATAAFWREGLKNLPNNFRVLILCVSPSQVPELIPDLENSKSILTTPGFRKYLNMISSIASRTIQKHLDSVTARLDKLGSDSSTIRLLAELPDIQPTFLRWTTRFVQETLFVFWTLVVFIPSWAYRITIKSTIWFWWPLAFIGGDLRLATKPDLLQWSLTGSLWAKTSIFVACLSLATFVLTNLFLDGAILQENPLIAPIGYLLLIDWRLKPWQICAIMTSLMSIVIVFWMNDIAGRLRIANKSADRLLLTKVVRELGWMERFTRVRFLFVVSFWTLVAGHAILYFNGQRCAVHLSAGVQRIAHALYGEQTPKDSCRVNRGLY